MHAMMEKLNTFENYEDAEAYLRGNTSWNFEDQTVKDFLYVIKKKDLSKSPGRDKNYGKIVYRAYTDRQYGRYDIEGDQCTEGM